MRRIASVGFCIILLVCLCACSAEKTYVMSPFKSDVTFVMSGVTVKGLVDFVSAEDITFTVKEPENISGIVFTADEVAYDDVKISYGSVGDSSPVYILFDILRHMASQEIKIPPEGEYSYASVGNSAGYKIIFNCEKNKITSIESGKFTYNFE